MYGLIPIVRELEDAVERRGRRPARLGSRRAVGHVVDRRRARIRQAADPAEARLDRLEDDDRAVYVHPRAPLGIRADERHLQGCEMDDVRDPVLVE
jgi:hypothetical protein